MSVIQHDFGKQARQSVREFRERLSLPSTHELNIKANPLPYLERAAERIFQLEKALFEAAQAGDGRSDDPCDSEPVAVDRDEYERLLRCRDIVRRALAEYGTDAEW